MNSNSLLVNVRREKIQDSLENLPRGSVIFNWKFGGFSCSSKICNLAIWNLGECKSPRSVRFFLLKQDLKSCKLESRGLQIPAERGIFPAQARFIILRSGNSGIANPLGFRDFSCSSKIRNPANWNLGDCKSPLSAGFFLVKQDLQSCELEIRG